MPGNRDNLMEGFEGQFEGLQEDQQFTRVRMINTIFGNQDVQVVVVYESLEVTYY